ncbi:MAG: hypothetical protein BWY73_01118 [candidate division TA06 bacterium ADurb.Bin417]|uniref:Uncharacterized protein n=1 Tax=candidate division TA06 bacterium ADurb.Bin417 TaxID=1852828 RepID=A0A1V5MEW2_UNCT6|nr:MAG: hypothetical protein BWY73_01118 [candidate division TA06 bacterium ADurb.Bin417]
MLKRYVQVGADFPLRIGRAVRTDGVAGQALDQPLAVTGRIGIEQADPPQLLNFNQPFQQAGQAVFFAAIPTVGGGILGHEVQLAHAQGGQGPGLGLQPPGRVAGQASPQARYQAIGAAVVAPLGDLQVGVVAGRAEAAAGQPGQFGRVDEPINRRVAPEEFFLLAGNQAAGQVKALAARPLQGGQLLQEGLRFPDRLGQEGAGVQKKQVGLFRALRQPVAGLEPAGQEALGVHQVLRTAQAQGVHPPVKRPPAPAGSRF